MAEIYKGVFEDDKGNRYYAASDTEITYDTAGIPLNNGGDLSEASVNFTVSSSRKALTAKARFKALMGDIAKWLTDLGPAAFYKVADDFTTTAENYLFTARKGKQLKDEVDNLNQNLGGAKIIHEGSGADVKYYAQLGADAASKKLLGSKNLTLFKKALIMDGTNVQRYWLFRLEEMDVSSYSSLKVECTASFQLTCNDIVLSQSGTIDLKGIDTVSLTLRLNGASNPYYPITVELLV
ncbi:hypothetical protein [Blautia sp.]|uniref:hypothetical protein n=1 Tax=Blautia sp. TaxID=1955243 RepID=UPI003AB2639D